MNGIENDGSEWITVPLSEYNALKAGSIFADALRSCGVHEWSGYDEAMELYHEALAAWYRKK
jgi:hypothetical protein